MRKISRLLLLSITMVTAFWSCEKDENKVLFEGGTPPVLTSTASATIPLAFATKDNEAVKLSWTNPDYNFSTGLSSQDVAYEIQIDTTGSNFTNPKKKSLSVSKELSYTFTQTELNDYLLNTVELKPGMSHDIEMRVKATLGIAVPLYSNVIKLKATPYSIPPKVAPPELGKLYITGSATAGSWMSDNPPSPVIPAQTFTKVSETLFEISSIALIGGQEYLLVPVFGNWSSKYGAKSGTADFNPEGGEFVANGNNFKGPAATGNYKIVVDFQKGTMSVTHL